MMLNINHNGYASHSFDAGIKITGKHTVWNEKGMLVGI